MNSGSQCDSRPCGKETLDRRTGRMPVKMGQRAGQQLFKQRNAESCQQIPRSQGQAAADPLMASGEQQRVTETTAQRQLTIGVNLYLQPGQARVQHQL